MTEVRKTLCNRDCPDACSIVATVEDGRVTSLTGDKDHPVTRGFLCYRTNQFLARQYDPARITEPLLKRNGEFVPIAWDEAISLAAERLTAIRSESGPAAIFHYRSGGSLGLLKHLSDYFFERFGPVTIKRGDICSGAGDAAQMTDFGAEDSHDLFDLEHSKHIILWGKNVYTSSPHLIPILRDARRRGTRITLIDPVHHRTAELADRFIQGRPAGDFALAMAACAILFNEAWIDPDAHGYCDHFAELRSLANSRAVEDWCREADVTVDEARHVAHALGVEKPAAILVGWGMGRRRTGGAIVRALDALTAISGNLGVPGGGVSFYFKRRGAFDTSFVRGEAVAPRTVCEPLFGEEVLALEDPPIRAVWITAGNPVAMLPSSETTARALESREFVVVVDSWMSDTARLAHLILPSTTLLEADDLVGSYGHHFIGSANPVVPPLGNSKSDLEIIQLLAAKVGLRQAMEGSARDWKRRMIRSEVVKAGATLDRLEQSAIRNPLAQKVLFADRRFPTETGRVNLVAHAPQPAPEVPGYPLVLMSLATEESQSSQWAVEKSGPAEVTIHPDAAPQLANGGLARLESRQGTLTVRVRHDEQQRRDVVLIPKGGHLSTGQCANALVKAETTDIGEGGALYDERVRLVNLPG